MLFWRNFNNVSIESISIILHKIYMIATPPKPYSQHSIVQGSVFFSGTHCTCISFQSNLLQASRITLDVFILVASFFEFVNSVVALYYASSFNGNSSSTPPPPTLSVSCYKTKKKKQKKKKKGKKKYFICTKTI